VVWTDEAGKLDFSDALEDMVRDARVILAREVRHSILKITPGGENDRDLDARPPDDPGETSAESLHDRHVANEATRHKSHP
jgi:glycerol-3-phosphate O-acyltransferase